MTIFPNRQFEKTAEIGNCKFAIFKGDFKTKYGQKS